MAGPCRCRTHVAAAAAGLWRGDAALWLPRAARYELTFEYSSQSSNPDGVGSTSMVPHSASPFQDTSNTCGGWCMILGEAATPLPLTAGASPVHAFRPHENDAG